MRIYVYLCKIMHNFLFHCILHKKDAISRGKKFEVLGVTLASPKIIGSLKEGRFNEMRILPIREVGLTALYAEV